MFSTNFIILMIAYSSLMLIQLC